MNEEVTGKSKKRGRPRKDKTLAEIAEESEGALIGEASQASVATG